jgi:hypothetical protein
MSVCYCFLWKENVCSVLMFSSQNIVIMPCSVHTACPPHLMVIISYNDNNKKLWCSSLELRFFVFWQIRGSQGTTVIKYIHIDVMCHITMDTTNETRKLEPHVMWVSGMAVETRGHAQAAAKLGRIENIGLSS